MVRRGAERKSQGSGKTELSPGVQVVRPYQVTGHPLVPRHLYRGPFIGVHTPLISLTQAGEILTEGMKEREGGVDSSVAGSVRGAGWRRLEFQKQQSAEHIDRVSEHLLSNGRS